LICCCGLNHGLQQRTGGNIDEQEFSGASKVVIFGTCKSARAAFEDECSGDCGDQELLQNKFKLSRDQVLGEGKMRVWMALRLNVM
jgi:hypothetical protein